MAIYDISMILRETMPVWPGDEPFHRQVDSQIVAGDGLNLSSLQMTAHCGTHVDALYHLLEDGATVDAIPPGVLIGPAHVMDIQNPKMITQRELREREWTGVERVLLKTANSAGIVQRDTFATDFVGMEADAAEFLTAKGLLLVGVDYLSVDPFDAPHSPAHRALLKAGTVIVEGLDLSAVTPGRYEMFCGPLRIAGGDGAPARVFLRDMEE